MDLTVDQSTFSRALRLIARVAPARATLPILQMALLHCEQGHLTLTSTDGDLGVSTRLAADVAAPGRTTLPARLLDDYVGQLPAEPVRLTLDTEQRRVRVSCGRFAANVATMEADDFPTFPAADAGTALDLDAGRLREAIERVAFAAARDESRPVLSAVLFAFGPDGLTLAAADGFRLARARLPEAAAAPQQLLVPARAATEFGRLLADAEAARLLRTPDGRGVYLAARETTLFTRLIEGRFPDIDRVIPREWRTRAVVETASFRQAVRVAGLFGGGEARPVVLEAAPDRLRLHARGDETGEAESELPATVEGDPQAVALNTRLLTDLLDVARRPQLEMSWTTPQTPVVVREAGQPDSADLSVMMPLFDPALVRRQAHAA